MARSDEVFGVEVQMAPAGGDERPPHAPAERSAAEVAVVLPALPVGAALLDAGGLLRGANAALCDLLGSPAPSIDDHPLGHVLHPDDHRLLARLVQADAGAPTVVGARLVRANGEVRWVRLHATRLADAVLLVVEDTPAAHSTDAVEQAAEERFELLARHVSDALLVVDASGVVTRASAGVLGILGVRPDAVVGQRVFDYVHPADLPAAAEAFRDSVDLTYDGPRMLGLRVRTADDDEWREVEVSATNHIQDGSISGLVLTLHDVTAIRRARAREQAADQRFGMLVDALPDPVLIVDDRDLLTYANTTACGLLGRDLHRLRGRPLADAALPAAVAASWQAAIRDVRARGEMTEVELSFPGATSPRWFLTRLAPETDDEGRVVKVVSISRDITERKAAERHLEDLARRDPLTGLANRRHLDEVLARALERCRASRQRIGVVFLDLDGLKRVNDTHGHDIGDGLLLSFARRLRRGARAHLTVGRLGGDEFVIVCEALVGPADATGVARRLLERLVRPYVVGGLTLEIATSIGLVTVGPDEAPSVTPADLLRDADAAMYHAKVHGGGTIAVFDRRSDQPLLPARRRGAPERG